MMICNSARRIASRSAVAAAPSSAFTRAASSTASTSIAASSSAGGSITSPPSEPSSQESSSTELETTSSSASSASQIYTPQYLNAGTKPAPRQTLSTLRALRASLFGQTHNPSNLRTGAKFLRKPLVGPGMLSYYPPEIKLGEVRSWLMNPIRLGQLSEEQQLASAVVATRMKYTIDEVQRLDDVARRKALGKGPPKKGQGRRAAMKNKTGKK